MLHSSRHSLWMKLVFVCGGTRSVCDVMIGVSWQHNAVSEVIATWEINFSVSNPTLFENFSMKTSESSEGIFTSYGIDSFVFLEMLLRLKHFHQPKSEANIARWESYFYAFVYIVNFFSWKIMWKEMPESAKNNQGVCYQCCDLL